MGMKNNFLLQDENNIFWDCVEGDKCLPILKGWQ
jgi:hypothetical protein